PEQVGGPSSEQQQAAEGEGVGAQHPLQVLRREAKVRLDRGQRYEHDRGVEEHHEEGATEERKRPPAPGIGCIQHVASTSWCGRGRRVAGRLHAWARPVVSAADTRSSPPKAGLGRARLASGSTPNAPPKLSVLRVLRDWS